MLSLPQSEKEATSTLPQDSLTLVLTLDKRQKFDCKPPPVSTYKPVKGSLGGISPGNSGAGGGCRHGQRSPAAAQQSWPLQTLSVHLPLNPSFRHASI